MDQQAVTSKNRWFQILFDYRKDYKKKYLDERKAKRIEGEISKTKDQRSKAKLRKELNRIQSEIKQQDEYLLEKYRLKRLLDPFNFSDEDFQDSPFIILEVTSQKDDWLTVKIDRSFPHTLIKNRLSMIMKDLDEAEGKKLKKSGRPKRINESTIISNTAKFWRQHYTKLQKIFEKSSGSAEDDFVRKIKYTTVSDLVLDELKEIYPYLKKSTLHEYAKPYQSK